MEWGVDTALEDEVLRGLSGGGTMNKQALDGFWDQFRQKYGVYLRLLDLIPADRYQSQPVPGLRSAAELAVHDPSEAQ